MRQKISQAPLFVEEGTTFYLLDVEIYSKKN